MLILYRMVQSGHSHGTPVRL